MKTFKDYIAESGLVHYEHGYANYSEPMEVAKKTGKSVFYGTQQGKYRSESVYSFDPKDFGNFLRFYEVTSKGEFFRYKYDKMKKTHKRLKYDPDKLYYD